MQAIEFETCLNDGLMHVPPIYSDWYNQAVKVILLKRESAPQPENAWNEVRLLHLRLQQKNRPFSDSAHLIREERDK